MHYIIHCPTYKEARKDLIHKAGRDARNLGKLLTIPDMIPHLFRYIVKTG